MIGGARAVALSLLVALSAAGCSVSGSEVGTEHTRVSISASLPGEALGLTIQGYRDDDLLCYSLSTLSGAEVASGCPLRSGTEDGAAFAASGPLGESWFAVIWVAEGVEIPDASAPFFRTSDGWVVLKSEENGFFWLDLTNLGARFHCSVGFSSLDCEMTAAPSSSSSSG